MIRSNESIFHRILHWRYLSAVNVLLILLIMLSFGREMVRRKDIDGQIHTLQKQAQEMQTQNIALTELHDAVQTESYIEREARLKLGLKKPGESVVILKGEGDRGDKSNKGNRGGDSTDPLGIIVEGSGGQKQFANSTKWWYYFFNKQAYHDAINL